MGLLDPVVRIIIKFQIYVVGKYATQQLWISETLNYEIDSRTPTDKIRDVFTVEPQASGAIQTIVRLCDMAPASLTQR